MIEGCIDILQYKTKALAQEYPYYCNSKTKIT